MCVIGTTTVFKYFSFLCSHVCTPHIVTSFCDANLVFFVPLSIPLLSMTGKGV